MSASFHSLRPNSLPPFFPILGVALILGLLPLGLLPAGVGAQWSSDAGVNLAVADGSGEQILPKLAPTSDGGCYVSWYDGGSGYDVRIQKLDSAGNPLFGADGVLVADRSFSSVQDYGLDVDAADNAILTFRDDRFTGVQITAAAIGPNGATLYGPDGVQLTSTTEFVAAPKIAGTSDGGVVVAWTQDVTTRVQKLDSNGDPLWANDVVLTPGGGSYSASDLHDAGTDAIVSFIHQLGGFGTPRHILAQKLDATGALLWGAAHVAVFDGGSVQFGNFPTFRPDGSGGGVFAWYDAASTQLQCSVQRILSDGTEAFAHDGVVVSTVASRVRVSPSVDFVPATQDIFVFWKEQTSSQSQAGVFGQKIDVTGVRQWTDAGVQVLALSGDDVGSIETWALGSGAMVFWDRAPSFGQDRLYGARVSDGGVLDLGPFDVASTPSGKSRLQVRETTGGFAVLAWQDGRTDSGDIYAQNVFPDGSLGGDPASVPEPLAVGWRALAAPNPSAGAVHIELRLGSDPVAAGGPDDAVAGSEARTADVFDVHGRLVRRGLVATREGGLIWDGRDDFQRRVAPGVFYVRIAGIAGATPVTIVR